MEGVRLGAEGLRPGAENSPCVGERLRPEFCLGDDGSAEPPGTQLVAYAGGNFL